ncbi:MAG TPA: cytochrome P460 family protein [Pseudomonadales bacterium]
MLARPLCALLLVLPLGAAAQGDLGIAQYDTQGQLLKPGNLDEWIQTGASLGSDYGEGPFDAQKPGAIGVVQMEPAAYRYFVENGSYADGTMFLLSFFRAEAQSSPQLPGYVQGDMYAQEIHVIDKARFDDGGHAFFMFQTPDVAASPPVAAGNDCVACHTEHGAFDGTFTQFYPRLRDRLAD